MIVKKCYALTMKCLRTVLGDCAAKKFDARLRFHRKLDLKNPTTLADKVSWLSINERSELIPICTDKFAVREYVSRKGFAYILIPLVGGPWSSVEEVDLTGLPDKFILKATHGCKMNYPVLQKAKMDMSECKQQMQKWLDTTYGTYSMEPHYERIPHRIYAEKLLESAHDLMDYKFHCLNGEPQFVLVCSERKADVDKRMCVTLDLFDTKWNPVFEVQQVGAEIPGKGIIPKPQRLDEMLQIARELSGDFKFVRVDLYELDGVVLFGELTFTPACGVFPYFSDAFIEEMGKKLTI